MKNKKTGIAGSIILVLLVLLQILFSGDHNETGSKNNENPAQDTVLIENVPDESNQGKSENAYESDGLPSFAELTREQAVLTIDKVDLADPPRFQKILLADVRSVDGDTFAFYVGDTEYRLRLLMVDTPESVKKDLPPQPYGKKAATFTKEQLQNKAVSIAFDKGSIKDHYDRYLAYVFIGEESLQQQLLEKGYGIVRYVNAGGDSYHQEFLSFQEEARKKQAAVWSEPDYVKATKRYYYFSYEDQ